MLRCVSNDIYFPEFIIINTFILPAGISCLIVSEASECLFVFSTCSVVLALSEFGIGVVLNELIDHELYIKLLLNSNYLMLLGVVNSRFQKGRQQFKFLALLLELGRFNGACRFHQLVEFVGSIWVIVFLLFLWRWAIGHFVISELGKSRWRSRWRILQLLDFVLGELH